MKSLRNIFCCIFLLSCAVAFGQPKVVAVTEIVDKYEHIPYSVKLQLRASLTKAISQKQGYAAVDRTDISHILEEQTFQRTGLVDDTTIKKLGSITGAKFILLAEAVKTDSSSSIYVNVKITLFCYRLNTTKLFIINYYSEVFSLYSSHHSLMEHSSHFGFLASQHCLP